ncbi:hypothetical protein ACFO3D_14150 [Virgibacillus kekensis]|uniref:Lipoprotein n=1 Tax=Virgibacillus kekensis TaxID=202261 RepID=A0ABV9DLT5_9BACI
MDRNFYLGGFEYIILVFGLILSVVGFGKNKFEICLITELRVGHIKYIVTSLMMFLSLIGCSENKTVINIDDKSSFSTLVIQKMENNSSSEEMTKIIRDKQKIKQILKLVEGVKVKETKKDYAFNQLKSKSSYMFGFFEGEKTETGRIPYAFYILADGTFIFTYKEVNSIQQPRITVKKHEDLLNEIKRRLEIDF